MRGGRACTCAPARTCWWPTTPRHSPMPWYALYHDADLWQHLATNGLRNVERHFSLDAGRDVVRRVLLGLIRRVATGDGCSSLGVRRHRRHAQPFGEDGKPFGRGIQCARRFQRGLRSLHFTRTQALVAHRDPAPREFAPRSRAHAGVLAFQCTTRIQAGAGTNEAVAAQRIVETRRPPQAPVARTRQARVGSCGAIARAARSLSNALSPGGVIRSPRACALRLPPAVARRAVALRLCRRTCGHLPLALGVRARGAARPRRSPALRRGFAA